MRAGRLRHTIIIQQNTPTRQDFGDVTPTWSDVATVSAEVSPNAGKQYYEAMQANSEAQGAVRIRYRSGIDASMRILWGTRVLNIISIVDPQERHRELLIYYRENQD